MGKTKPFEQVIADLENKFSSDCDFSLITKENYIDTLHLVPIICKRCGETYFRTPKALIRRGTHCCHRPIKFTLSYFFERLTETQKEKYDYSLVEEIVNSKVKIPIICKKCNNVFYQSPAEHLNGANCPNCWAKQKPQFGKRKKIYGVGIFDVDYAQNVDEITQIAYKHWKNMLNRCYSKNYQNNRTTYANCKVDERWHKFSCFKEWFVIHYKEGYALDKDLLSGINKVYSPQTCCFVPQEINAMIVTRQHHCSRFGKGVSITKEGKYAAFITKYGKTYNLGHYNTQEEAFNAYRKSKIVYVREIADKYFQKGEIEEYVYEALYKYEPKIKD